MSFKPYAAGLALSASSLFLVGCSPSEKPSEPQLEATAKGDINLFPGNNDTGINPDTHLFLTFETTPEIRHAGRIDVVNQATGEVVDTIDMSVPYSPNPDGRSTATTEAERRERAQNFKASDYQYITLGGYDFIYHPVLIHETTAQIDLHPGALDYGQTYQVRISPDVFESGDESFSGFDDDTLWTFSTKAAPPSADTQSVTVAADGSGDFNTVQGAIEFAPAASPDAPFEIMIEDGRYDELVFLSEKSDIIIRGESREGVVVGYPNNSAFNPPQPSPSRRPAFSLFNVEDIQLSDFTINNDFIGQAEALLVRGERVILDNMQLNGSGDALTTYGSIYMVDSELTGHGDTILGYAALYCENCTLRTYGPFTWTRTPEGQHGNVFVDSTFIAENKPLPWTVTEENPEGRKTDAPLARLPRNGPGSSAPNFPHAEMVLIDSTLIGLDPVGWGPVEDKETFDWSGVNFMEFNSVDENGDPLDLSDRHPIVKILDAEKDAETIANYRDPEFVLNGWSPEVR